MTIREIQDEIVRLKTEKDITVLAHTYQAKEIIEVADYTGDSYKLAVLAQSDTKPTAIMCGVRFMGETVKILSPEKTVYLANGTAGCPMADGLSYERLQQAIAKYPNAAVVCYINTTAEIKTLCDVCVTSSSAVRIIKAMPQKEILFVPDCNLGAYVASQIPEKDVRLISGGCPIHAAVTGAEAIAAKAEHPGALLLVHPECTPDVVGHADFVGSTSEIYDFALKSDNRDFIIGTEISIAEHLQYAAPDKRFHALSKKLMCHNMKLTTLMDLYHTLKGDGGEVLEMDAELIANSRKSIDEMIRLGGK